MCIIITLNIQNYLFLTKSMPDQTIKEQHLQKAFEYMNKVGIPQSENDDAYELYYNDKIYPSTYTFKIASTLSNNTHGVFDIPDLNEINGIIDRFKTVSIKKKLRKEWTDRECYFAVWCYDQFDLYKSVDRVYIYKEISSLIRRTRLALKTKVHIVSSCDSRSSFEKPVAEAPHTQKLVSDVFDWYWSDRERARLFFPKFMLDAQLNIPSSRNWNYNNPTQNPEHPLNDNYKGISLAAACSF